MDGLRFIHTGDIHLGSFLHIEGESLPPFIEKIVETATLEGFKRVCDTAIAEDVDFVAISGDLYDGEIRSVKAMAFFVEQCSRLKEANIDVLVIAGNHDPLRGRQDLFQMPDNVKTFDGDKPEIYQVLDEQKRPIARVIGQSYRSSRESNRIYLDYKVCDRELWNIALLHTQLESGNSNYIPCSLGDLKGMSDFHYWALGHIHQFRVLNDSHPLIAYSGIPQGRDFGEEGRGGCILVELDSFHGGSITFIPTAPVVYKRVDIHIDEDPDNAPETIQDLEDMIYQWGERILKGETVGEEKGHPIEGYVVEWIIRGRGIIHDLLKEQEQESLNLVIKELRSRFGSSSPFLWTESIVLRTQPAIDYDKLMKGSPVFEEIEAITQKCLEDGDMKAKLLRELGEIWSHRGDHENNEDFRFFMDETTLEEILNDAKQLIVEKLAERRE